MGEADGTPKGASGRRGASERTGADAIRTRLDRLVAQASAADLWERGWPLLWRGFGVALAFLAVSWLGLWLDLPPLWRIVGLAAFALLFVAGLVPLLRVARPSRRQALARIDRDAAQAGASAHDPASAIEDTLAVGGNDPATRALWALHQRRAAASIARLKVAAPRPEMPRHDPFALRAGMVVATVAAFFVAGSEWRERIGAAFDWREAQAAAPSFRVDGWIDPPLYTRLPPLILAMTGGEQHLRAPVNSVLIVRVAGQGEVTLTPNAALKPVVTEDGKAAKPPSGRTPPAEAHTTLREERFQLTGGMAELAVAASGARAQRLIVETIPDLAPEIRQVGPFEVNGRGTFNLTYRAKDDYGIASAEGLVEPVKLGRSLVPLPRLPLALPSDITGETDTKTLVDLTDNPWSGAKVRLSLVARDEAGQEGRTAPAEVTLPARPFAQALARSLAEERRRLVTAPDDDRRRVQTALDALLIAPERFTPQPAIFLGLKTAAHRLRVAGTDADLLAVADLLWEMALKIEDGDLSDAEKQLRQAQDRLKEAIERGAPDEEIAKLTQDLKQALDKFMKEFAQRQQQNPQGHPKKQAEQGQKGAKTVTPDDLEKMVKDMQEAMKRGDTAEAQRLLEQLRNTLENLQSAEGGQKSDSKSAEMNRQMQELDKMSREQQDLRDQTYKDGQEKQDGRRQKQGQQQRGQGEKPGSGQNQQDSQGQQGGKGGGGGQGQAQQGEGQSPGQRQQALRERLEDLQRRMKENGGQGEQGLSDAEGAMREAEEALRQGREGEAVDAQGRALEGLKKGAEGLQQQQEQMAEGEGQGDQPGGEAPSPQGQAGAADDDPLGRPSRGRDMSNGRVRVPNADESAVQRARKIMEELRRKLGDPTRPQEELDYFDRLLRRN